MRRVGYESLLEKVSSHTAEVTVALTLCDDTDRALTALQSIVDQDAESMDLVIVDDRSRVQSATPPRNWLRSHHGRFNRLLFIQHDTMSGRAAARNTAFSLAATELVYLLDSDHELYPRCVRRCLEAIRHTDAAFVFPMFHLVGAESGLRGTDDWGLDKLAKGADIGSTSLVRAAAWERAGGYSSLCAPLAEDYDFWCKIAESGAHGARVSEILARYHVRDDASRANVHATDTIGLERRHPWLLLAQHS